MGSNETVQAAPRRVSAVWQFICLLAPTVMTGFYLVYALVGLILSGDSKLRWCDEALDVGLFVLMIIAALNIPVMLYARWLRLPLQHVLWISPIAHIAIATALTLTIATLGKCG
jgi:hypothetical protein